MDQECVNQRLKHIQHTAAHTQMYVRRKSLFTRCSFSCCCLCYSGFLRLGLSVSWLCWNVPAEIYLVSASAWHLYKTTVFFLFWSWFFKTEFLSVALAALELICRQAGLELCLPLPPMYWHQRQSY